MSKIKIISEESGDWDEILKLISENQLTPIIGKELYKFVDGDNLVLLDARLSRQILASNNVTDQPEMTLTQAVNYLVNEKIVDNSYDLITPLKYMIGKINNEFPLLTEFLSITDFNYFLNTEVSDNILENKLKTIRNQKVDSIYWSDKQLDDCKPLEGLDAPLVFNIFGSLNSPYLALSDEELLEYTGTFYEKIKSTSNIKGALNQSLLFIGCSFPDWMVRFVLRLLTNQPLNQWGASNRKIYIINDDIEFNEEPNAFLKNYKVKTYEGNTSDFVKELKTRWQKFDEEKKMKIEEAEKLGRPVAPKMIFLSYTREDKVAVETLKGSLEKIDHVTCYYDIDRINAGDKWNDEINYNIRKADLFIPLISANSLTHEGFIQEEWREGVNEEGVRRLDGRLKKFLMPIVIDNSNLYDPNLPAFFKELDIKPVLNGNPDEKFINNVKASLQLI